MLFFFFNDTATTEIYTLSLHDALPIFLVVEDDPAVSHSIELMLRSGNNCTVHTTDLGEEGLELAKLNAYDIIFLDLNLPDRKSTRLNSSHANISYAVFCLKKKTNNTYA